MSARRGPSRMFSSSELITAEFNTGFDPLTASQENHPMLDS